MKLSAIWREARLDVASGTSRTVLYSALLAILIGVLASLDVLQTQQILRAAADYQRSGASISIISAPGQIDPTACEALNAIDGIRAAGAVRAEQERLTLSLLPAAPVPINTVSPHFPSLLNAAITQGPGLVLSDQVVADLGVSQGSNVQTADGPARVAGTFDYPSDGRESGYGYAILIPSNEREPFDECWADIWPQSDTVRSLLYTTLTHGNTTSSQPSLGQLNTTLGTEFGGYATFEHRVTRFAPALSALGGILLGYIWLRVRRLQVASQLHAGVTRQNMRTILLLELASWTVPGAVLSLACVAVLIAGGNEGDRTSLMLLAGRVAFSALVGVTGGALIAWRLTQEKHLFAYFKDR